jgi:hypothetical protein
MTWELLAWTMWGIFVLIFALGGFGAYTLIREYSHDKRSIRYRRLTRYSTDEQGNYEYSFDPNTGESFEPPPGNQPQLPPQFVNGIMPTQLPPEKQGARHAFLGKQGGRPIGFWVDEIEKTAEIPVNFPESRKSDLQLPNADLQVLQLGKSVDLLPIMRQMIQEGRGKTTILKELGLTGRHYAQASKVYEMLYAEIAVKGKEQQ